MLVQVIFQKKGIFKLLLKIKFMTLLFILICFIYFKGMIVYFYANQYIEFILVESYYSCLIYENSLFLDYMELKNLVNKNLEKYLLKQNITTYQIQYEFDELKIEFTLNYMYNKKPYQITKRIYIDEK